MSFISNKKSCSRVVNIASNYKMKIINVINFLYKKLDKKKKINWVKSKKKPFLIDFLNAKKLGFKASSVKNSLEKYINSFLHTL